MTPPDESPLGRRQVLLGGVAAVIAPLLPPPLIAKEMQGRENSLWYTRPADEWVQACQSVMAAWAPWCSAESPASACNSTKTVSSPVALTTRSIPGPRGTATGPRTRLRRQVRRGPGADRSLRDGAAAPADVISDHRRPPADFPWPRERLGVRARTALADSDGRRTVLHRFVAGDSHRIRLGGGPGDRAAPRGIRASSAGQRQPHAANATTRDLRRWRTATRW